ncbi:MAG: T9SS type A sorting domain-containing protein [Bacteroidetes bacterium]|nr:T9SS type A sorting domain-containing protein [Bacteroidota bacterium]
MIKKLLLSFSFVAVIGIYNVSAQATCTPDFSCLATGAAQGICPDSTMGLPPATISTAYSTTMSIKIPSTTVSGGTTYNLTHLAVTDVLVDMAGTGTYVPLTTLGIDYLGNGSNTPSGGASGPSGVTMTRFCYWPAPSGACVVVSGTPNTTGTFPIRIKSQARAIVFGFPAWIAAPDNDQYSLVVNAAAGISSLNLAKFDVDQNSPNPFSDNTEIHFSSLSNSNVDFKVYNMLGAVIYNNSFKADKGVNTIKLGASTFAPGVYIYSITNGDQTITKRMIVAGK